MVSTRPNPNTKLVFDRSLSEWTARYRKNKTCLDAMCFQIYQIRQDLGKTQEDVDRREGDLQQLHDKMQNDVTIRAENAQKALQTAKSQQAHLNAQLSEQRKTKTKLAKDLSCLRGDYDRKYAELNRTVEQRIKLDSQLDQLTRTLGSISNDRKRMQHELGSITQHLAENTGTLQDISNEVTSVRAGIRNSVELHMQPPQRFDGSRHSEWSSGSPHDSTLQKT
eukprot:GEMP01060081.1.p1 GENE.GEMP01060081.1~~GEMP01060081.1.p1  ORF type:complete len:251 (+),score=51.81 GEMP01060081.1:87-755(+)